MRIGTRKKRLNLIRMVSTDQSIFAGIYLSFGTGEPIVEPEVDLSSFLERQRLADDVDLLGAASKYDRNDEDIDATLAHISSYPQATPKKGKVEQIVWDEELDRMNQDKKAAEATWGMSRPQVFANQILYKNFSVRS